MITALAILFAFAAAYGVLIGQVGAGLLSFLMVGVCIYAERHFAEQDRKWANDPANAREVKQDALCDLERHKCECMRSKQ